MDEKLVQKLSPLIKNMDAWRALLVLIDLEKQNIIKQLLGEPSSEKCIRKSAELTLLERLSKAQETYLRTE